MGSQPAQQIPGVYHRRIGDIIVTAISDSYLDGSIDVMRNIDLEKAERILKDAFRPVRRTNVNAFLIHSKGRLAIVDTGSGNYLLPTAGFVQRSLASAGIDPTAIDTVLLTHMHPDHSAGLTDMSNGQLLFPNAELVMHEDEPAHWFDDGAMSRADERARKLYFQAGREQVAPYKNRTRLFRQGEIFPGVTAVPSVGHTPGHSAYLVASGKDQLMIWGDTVHVPEVQTAFPEAGMHRSRRGRGGAQTHVRSRRCRRHPGRRDALALPVILAPCAARRRLCALSRGLGAHAGCDLGRCRRRRPAFYLGTGSSGAR
jgi:glyoxylase-like metal-dependent hydrolase (beta-lactamase superfamily II)